MRVALGLVVLCSISAASCGNEVLPVASRVPESTESGPSDSTGTPLGDSTRTVLPSATPARPDSLNKNPTPGDSVPPPAPPPTPAPTDSISPTGRRPRLVWTPQKQATWARMKQENHPLYQVLANNCQQAVNGSPRYADRGLWCTIMFQITGNLTYARAAWRLAEPIVTGAPYSANDVREYTIENAILFDWLYPALSASERDAAIDGLNGWASYALAMGTGQYAGGIHTEDSDASVGYYFGLAAIDLATAGLSPKHVNWLNTTQTVGTTLPVGGLDATGVNRQTARNTVRQYVEQLAAGGEWFESSEYNLGTQVLLAMGAAAVRTATGADHFPEVTAYLVDAARAQSYFITPDLQQSVQWGDLEHPRGFVEKLYEMTTLLGTFAGETEWNSQAGPQVQGLLQALFAKYGTSGYLSAEPWARFFLFENPYAAATDWQSGVVAKYFAGTGHMFVHAGSALFEARMVQPTGADHELGYLSDFQLYSNGEWVITHPLGYNSTAILGQSVNGLLVAGLSTMTDRGPDAVQSGNSWWSMTGSTRGPFYDASYWDPPPAFLQEWRRTVVYLRRNGLDIVVVQDSVDASNPTSVGRYRASDQATIAAAPGLVQFIMHAPANPTIAGNTAYWRTPGGQPVSVTTLSPTAYSTTVLPETSVLDPIAYHPEELTGYQLRVIPNFTGGQTVLRHVIIVGGGQSPDVQLTGNAIRIGTTTVTIGATVSVTN